jgi:sugar phosphate isomerase/epimerase
MIFSLENYYNNSELLKKSIDLLGPYIKSCHAKDIKMGESFPIEIVETAAGKGTLDYRTYISEISQLGKDIPFMVEHLKTDREYREAVEYIRAIGEELKV